MANENLFPPLDWSNWDSLSSAENNQRYYTPPVTQEELTKSFDDILVRFANDPQGKAKAIQELRQSGRLTPYNYVPPRHALEPHMGFGVDPENAYRLMGERVMIPVGADPASVLKDKTIALQDFLNTGQVRGNPAKVNGGRVFLPQTPEQAAQTKAAKIAAGGTIKLDLTRRTELPQAYFFPRHPQPVYYINSDLTPSEEFVPVTKSGKSYAMRVPNDGFIGQNTVIEINKDFAPINQTQNPSSRNPLYYMGNQNGEDANAFRLRGGLWGENTGQGAHITANPRENPSFFDVANPANRKGIRIYQESAPALTLQEKISLNNRAIYGKTPEVGVPDTNGNIIYTGVQPQVEPSQTAGTAPESAKMKWTTKYDRITPFKERPLATHVANAKAEAEIFLNAAKSRPLSTKVGSLGAAAGLGGAVKAVGLVAGGVLTPVQLGMQTAAANSNNMMDREYGHSDPLALRPMVDLALSGIGNNQTPAQGWRAMGNRVADPEWQLRNPITAVPYNLIHGNTEPAKAFLEGYVPQFLK